MAIYKDLNLTLKMHPGTKDVLKLNDVEAVKQSIKNVLMSGAFDSPFDPYYGGHIRRLLFELTTPTLIATSKRLITKALEEYEPRAVIEEIYVGESVDSNALNVGIRFYVTGIAALQTVNYSLGRVS